MFAATDKPWYLSPYSEPLAGCRGTIWPSEIVDGVFTCCRITNIPFALVVSFVVLGLGVLSIDWHSCWDFKRLSLSLEEGVWIEAKVHPLRRLYTAINLWVLTGQTRPIPVPYMR